MPLQWGRHWRRPFGCGCTARSNSRAGIGSQRSKSSPGPGDDLARPSADAWHGCHRRRQLPGRARLDAMEAVRKHARFAAHGETAEVDYTIDEKGAVNMPRWGNPEGAAFHYANCGGLVEQEGTFG